MKTIYIAVTPSAPGTPIHAQGADLKRVVAKAAAAEPQYRDDAYVYCASRRYRSGAQLVADHMAGRGGVQFLGIASEMH